MHPIRKIGACLWFDHQAEEAANFYVSVFPNSKIIQTARFTEEGFEVHRQPAGQVMTVDFELDGQSFMALNGGPHFHFNEAVSFVITCDTQDSIDYYWATLSQGGDAKAQQCGWLKDKYGISWQVVPTCVAFMMTDPDTAKASRAMRALLPMKKLDISTLERAFDGP